MPDEVTTGLGEFFDYCWKDTEGFVYIATLDKGVEKSFSQYMLPWPEKRTGIIRHVLAQNAAGKDVYYSPAIYKAPSDGSKPRPTKENVLGTHVLWADFDGTAPEDWGVAAKEKGIPEPTRIVQSSIKGHEHAYWQLSEFATNIEAIEDRNRSIAYSLGADTSGWDADQLLRPAYTTNHGYKNDTTRKPWYQDSGVTVSLLQTSESEGLSLEAFSSLGSPEREVLGRLAIGTLPSRDELLALGKWTTDLLARFNMTKEEASASSPDKRSGAIMALGYSAAEAGFNDEQIYAMLVDVDVRWEKYVNRSNAGRDKLFRDIIARARAKVGYRNEEELTFAGLLGGGTQVSESTQLVYGFQSFLDTEIHIEWLLEGLLAQGGHGLITGQPGVGKTQVGIQLAIALALGSENVLHWKNLSGSPKKVLFASLEMGHAPLKHFMETIAPRYRDRRTLERNLNIAPLGATVPLDRGEGQAFLNNLVAEYRPDVLFIDSVQKMTYASLTDDVAVRAFNEYLSRLRQEYGCATYLVHHNRKKGSNNESAGNLSDLFGSQFLAADTDFVVNLRKQNEDDPTSAIYVDAWKNRLAAGWKPFLIERDEYIQFNVLGGDASDLDLDGANLLKSGRFTDIGKSGPVVSLEL